MIQIFVAIRVKNACVQCDAETFNTVTYSKAAFIRCLLDFTTLTFKAVAFVRMPQTYRDRSISGLSQKLEACNLENQSKRSGDSQPEMSSPRPVFHQVNGRRPHFQKSPQETITPQHEEIIKYIHETWKSVYREYESGKETVSEGKAPNVVYYQDKSTNLMPNFQPFDLETFWGQRLFQNITQST